MLVGNTYPEQKSISYLRQFLKLGRQKDISCCLQEDLLFISKLRNS